MAELDISPKERTTEVFNPTISRQKSLARTNAVGSIRILALTRYDRLGASSRIRSFQYHEPLLQHGVILDTAPLFSDAYVRALYAGKTSIRSVLGGYVRRVRNLLASRSYDAIRVEKEALPWLPAFVESLLIPSGMPLILDYDDAVFHRYDRHRSPVVRALLGRKIEHVMARADLVIVGNEYLADWARIADARRIEIIPTVVDTERYIPMPRPSDNITTVGWIGSPNTAPYLEIVKPVLKELASRIPLKCIAIGARPDQVAGSVFEAVPWSEETEIDLLRQVDIGIMPLADTPWERGKCGYKLIQCMALGIPVVASPVGVNATLVRQEENGLLASDTTQWTGALARLSAAQDLRQAMGRRGRELVRQSYSLDVWAPRTAALFKSVICAE